MTERPRRKLPLRDTPELYGLITRILHWSIAAMILWQFIGMGLRLIFGRQAFVAFFVGSHQPVGFLIFLLVLLRVVWAVVNRRHRPAHGKGLVGKAAVLGHGLLYALMFVIPAAALLRAFGSERGFAPFGLTVFPPRGAGIEWMAAVGNALHGELAWGLAVMALGHVVMVALHEGMWRDGTLARMVGRAQTRLDPVARDPQGQGHH